MSCRIFFITEFSLSLTARFVQPLYLLKKIPRRNNFITRMICFSQLVYVLRSTPPRHHSISNGTAQSTAYIPLRICVRALHARGPSLVPDIHENSRVWGGQRGRGREGCTCSGFDFQSTIRYCQLFSVHVGPLWICREMAVDYCIRSGTVMSICIMHRLNKRVAVLSDVVEHDGGRGCVPAAARKTTIDRRRILDAVHVLCVRQN